MPNDTTDVPTLNIIDITADIVAAYASGNHFAASELPKHITAVHGALNGFAQPQQQPQPQHDAPAEEPVERPTPSQIKKSIAPDALVSFVDGKPYKTLRRHLTMHGLGFEEYRARYGLPSDYPSVAASYSATRSVLAKELGLGNQRRKVAAPEPAPEPAAKRKRAGRTRKVAEPA